MKYPVTLGLLVIANLLLLGWFAGGLGHRAEPHSESAPPEASGISAPTVASKNGLDPSAAAASPARSEKAHQEGPRSEILFAHVYSPDPKQFAANLRAIHCPEETIKDILTAEVHRWFQPQEQALRPTPADHVPFAWSAKTAEPKLIERRQKAAALARDESALLHDALSCELNVPIPLYAMTTSDQQFEAVLASSVNSCAIREIQDGYWTRVQALQQRTKGFWLPEDVAEVESLKAQRKQALSGLLPGQ